MTPSRRDGICYCCGKIIIGNWDQGFENGWKTAAVFACLSGWLGFYS